MTRLSNVLYYTFNKIFCGCIRREIRYYNRLKSRPPPCAHVLNEVDSTSIICNAPADCRSSLLESSPRLNARPGKRTRRRKLLPKIPTPRRITRGQHITNEATQSIPLPARNDKSRFHVNVTGRSVCNSGHKNSSSAHIDMPVQISQSANSLTTTSTFRDLP
jgi:hypothetical protein